MVGTGRSRLRSLGRLCAVGIVLLFGGVVTIFAQNTTGRVNFDPPPLVISTHDVLVKVGKSAQVLITPTSNFVPVFQNATSYPIWLVFHTVPSDARKIRPLGNITLVDSSGTPVVQNFTLDIVAQQAGKITITSEIVPEISSYDPINVFARVSVYKLDALNILSSIVGWIYFVAWSVSFYPQIIQNFQRKSVRGLSLDFVFLNITGFALYGIYNVGLFWVPSVQDEYYKLYPQGVIPVEPNDVGFTLHALFACAVTAIQCLIYDRGAQTISDTGKMLLCTILVFIFVIFVVAASQAITWLTFLSWCSYVKLVITMIKYMPQAYLNWYRKSTSGWSIGNVLLDFTGGIFSLTQMMFIIYNHNDWSLISGDLTKFGLGLFSILFDIFFIVQHYILYRNHAEYEPIEGGDTPVEPSQYGGDITTSNHHFHSSVEGDNEDEKGSMDNYQQGHNPLDDYETKVIPSSSSNSSDDDNNDDRRSNHENANTVNEPVHKDKDS